VRTVVVGHHPELEALVARRRQAGLDRFDEVWEGEYHVAPAAHFHHGYLAAQLARVLRPYAENAGLVEAGPFNLGQPDDHRVPDGGYLDAVVDAIYVPSAAIVIEVLSPDDETFAKFAFYHRHGVAEIFVLDPAERSLNCWRRSEDGFEPAPESELLGAVMADLVAEIRWP
jgi:Uma2 family endonuclease